MPSDPLIDQLKAALQASPTNLPLRLLLARKLMEATRKDEALALLVDLEPQALGTADATDAATLLLDGGEAGWAERVVEGCYDRGRSSARFLHVAARVRAELNDWNRAAQAWMMAREVDPALTDPALDEKLAAARPEPPQKPALRVVVGGKEGRRDVEPAPTGQTLTFADVGGYDELKKTVHRKIILPFQKPDLFQKYGKQAGGGILLYGPPGCGKTHLARATAGECGAVFMNVAIEDVLDMWQGESERKLHALFQLARDRAPAVLFIDEIEALGGRRSATIHQAAGILVSSFLSEMDGFGKSNQKVLIMGATNVPWAVDPAFRRPGRFDNVVFVPPPDRPAREAIISILLRNRPARDVDAAAVAARTSGFSGADLKHLIETAFDLVIEEAIESGGEPPLSIGHVTRVLPKIRPTTTEWLSTARNYALYSNEGGQYDDVLAFIKEHGR
ncbi:MAG: AAA family ATPase [Candidatus Riflebacteria bacterium]|nr:AAA family ATPase [Candidatus Riflebacteria bacterium]